MKVTDWIVNKFGSDKVLHFFGGGWITSMLTPIGWWGVLIGVVITAILSVVKEKWLDSFFDWKDICAAMCGSAVSVLIFFLLTLIL